MTYRPVRIQFPDRRMDFTELPLLLFNVRSYSLGGKKGF